MIMLARLVAVSLALCAMGCRKSKIPTGAGSFAPDAGTVAQRRCALGPQSWAPARVTGRVIGVTRTTTGFAYATTTDTSLTIVSGTETRVIDRHLRGESLAWFNGRYFLPDEGTLSTIDEQSLALDTRQAPRNSTLATVAAGPSSAVWVYARTVGRGTNQALEAVLIDSAGNLRGPARRLGASITELRSVSARWDFARFVVTAETWRTPTRLHWVLDPEAQPLWNTRDETPDLAGSAALMACPTHGCVYLRGLERGGEAPELFISPIDSSWPGWLVGTPVGTLRAVTVSGSLLAVLDSHQDFGPCQLTVVDLSRRAVLFTSPLSDLRCAQSDLSATRRGFVIVGASAQSEDTSTSPTPTVWSRPLDCDD